MSNTVNELVIKTVTYKDREDTTHALQITSRGTVKAILIDMADKLFHFGRVCVVYPIHNQRFYVVINTRFSYVEIRDCLAYKNLLARGDYNIARSSVEPVASAIVDSYLMSALPTYTYKDVTFSYINVTLL